MLRWINQRAWGCSQSFLSLDDSHSSGHSLCSVLSLEKLFYLLSLSLSLSLLGCYASFTKGESVFYVQVAFFFHNFLYIIHSLLFWPQQLDDIHFFLSTSLESFWNETSWTLHLSSEGVHTVKNSGHVWQWRLYHSSLFVLALPTLGYWFWLEAVGATITNQWNLDWSLKLSYLGILVLPKKKKVPTIKLQQLALISTRVLVLYQTDLCIKC